MTTKRITDDPQRRATTPEPISVRLKRAEDQAKKLTEEIRALYEESRQETGVDKTELDKEMEEVLSREYTVDAPQPLPEPWTVKRFDGPQGWPIQTSRRHTGKLVKVRPCGEEYKGKTFLGFYIGDIALGTGIAFNQDTQVIHSTWSFHNPAIFIPSLGKVVFGCESWWGVVKSEEDTRDITDEDISNIWYVKALKELGTKEGRP